MQIGPFFIELGISILKGMWNEQTKTFETLHGCNWGQILFSQNMFHPEMD